jgi:hypothetical protein
MRVLTLLMFATLALSAARSYGDKTAPLVADFGNPDRLTVRGATTIAESTIVRELYANIDVVKAADPAVPLEEFERVLCEKAIAGYRHLGFAEATVQANLDEQLDKLVLTIVEGPRYLAGEVEISGLPDAKAAWLRDKLAAENAADEEKAVGPWTPDSFKNMDGPLRWPVGKAAWCDSETRHQLQRRIEELLFDDGLLFPEFTVRVRLDKQSERAGLVIEVADPGLPAALDEIVIVGNETNSREDVLKYLGLAPGIAVRTDLRNEVIDKLAQSGRFTESKVEFNKPAARGERLTMKITLTEYKKAPSLREPFSKEEAALVRLSKWLSRFNESDEEIIIERKTPGMTAEFVVAPRRGIIGMLRETVQDEAQPDAPFVLAAVFTEGRLGVFSTALQRQFSMRNVALQARAGLQLSIHDGPPKFDGRGSLSYGLQFRSGSPYRRPIHVALKDTAVAMLALAHEYNADLSWSDDVLTVWYAGRQLKLDSVTGRLLAARGGDSAGTLNVACSSGEFDRRLQDIEKLARKYPNDFDRERPLTSAAMFACDAWMARLRGDARERWKISRRLLELGLLQPVDRELVAIHQTDAPYFWIPPGENSRQFAQAGSQIAKYVFSSLGNRLIHALVPRGSWPERLAHETVFAALGESRRLLDEAYYAPDGAGPLWRVSSAAALWISEMQGASARCAREGMRRMSPQDFVRDCAALRDTSGLLGRCITNAADVLSRLDEAEAAALCKTLTEGGAVPEMLGRDLAASLELLRHHPGRVRDTDLECALETLWQLALRDRVERALWKLAGTSPRKSLLTSPVGGNEATKGGADDSPLFQPSDPLFKSSDLFDRGAKRK